jgi:protein toll
VYDAVLKSRRTLVVLSENYVNSAWGRNEFRVAHTRALQDRVDRVIVIVYGDVPAKESMDDSLRTYVNMKTYLKWGDPLFWERLRLEVVVLLTSFSYVKGNMNIT